MSLSKYTYCKSSRLYDGGAYRGEFDSFEEAKASVEAQGNPVGFDIYRVGAAWPTREVRPEVLNMSSEMWDKYNSNPKLHWAADEFLDTIGLAGGLTAKSTSGEDLFFEDLYRIYRNRNL